MAAWNKVKTIEEFIKQFPTNETAICTVKFDACPSNGDIAYIKLQVKQTDGYLLTYIREMDGQSEQLIERETSKYVKMLDDAKINHDRVINDTPKP